MNFIKTILNKISPGIKKGIGIYVSADSTLEMVEYDYDLGEINNYSKIDFEYDSVLREINTENFEAALQNMLRKFEISPQVPVTLTVPSIFINKKVLPMELAGDEIHTALVSETEKKYIFKKSEPTVSWNVISTDKDNQLNTIIYSALQKQMVEKIEGVFKRQGVRLTALETSYSAFVRGLSVSGLVDDYIEKNNTWAVFVIKNTSNAVITIRGTQILNIAEAPLALNSLEPDDLYPSLVSNLTEKLEDAQIEALVTANYSHVVDVNNLLSQFDLNVPVIKIQNNFYKGDALFSIGVNAEAVTINPEVIGSACWKTAPVHFGFNFLGGNNQDDMPGLFASLGIAGNPLHLILLGLITIAFLLITTISILAIPINASLEKHYQEIFIKCSQYEEKFNKPQSKVFNLFDVIQNGFNGNEKLITSFDAISSVIPEKVWVSSIEIDEKLNANIKGKAYNVEDIVRYYENLLSVSKFNNFKIKSIKVVGENSEIENNNPDVSVNTIGNNSTSSPDQQNNPEMQPPQLPTPIQGGTSMLPPPPPSGASVTSLASLSGSKYYEFDFGNPVATPVANATDKKEESKTLIPDLSGITKNLKLGN